MPDIIGNIIKPVNIEISVCEDTCLNEKYHMIIAGKTTGGKNINQYIGVRFILINSDINIFITITPLFY